MLSINVIGELVTEMYTMETPSQVKTMYGVIAGTTETLNNEIWLYYTNEYETIKYK